MNITWLGQAGLIFETVGFRIMVDPYLSDSVGEIDPEKHRRTPVDPRFFSVKPDVLIFTHDHLDHYDPETVRHFLSPSTDVLVLSPRSVYEKVRKTGGKNRYVLFRPGSVWTEKSVRFTAVPAEHSDPEAIGVIIDDGEKKYYVTGDTLYNESIFPELPPDIHAVFLPVNGVGNNMNMADAARFASKTGASVVCPVHIGLFDDLSADGFPCDRKVNLEIYRETVL